MKNSTIIEKTALEPNLSIAATMKDLPTGQQLLLSLRGEPSDVPLQAQITQPNGTSIATFDIKDTPFTGTATTQMSGDHTLLIKNVGTKSVTIDGALLNSPISPQGGGVSVKDNPALQNLIAYGIGILVGIILVIAGIVILIIGAIKYFKGKKAAPPSSPAK